LNKINVKIEIIKWWYELTQLNLFHLIVELNHENLKKSLLCKHV